MRKKMSSRIPGRPTAGARVVATDPRSNDEDRQIKKKDDERVFEGDFPYRHLWVVEIADGATATRVTEGRDFTLAGDPPSWSPEGSRLVFSANVTTMLRDERQDVYIADIASRQITKISTNFGRDSRPQWSPDGARIAWVMDPNTAKPNGDGTPAGVVAQSHLVIYDVSAAA